MTKHDDNWGVLQSQQDEDQARASAVSDPAGYHANIAARELHWFNASASQWLSRCEGLGEVGTLSREGNLKRTQTGPHGQRP